MASLEDWEANLLAVHHKLAACNLIARRVSEQTERQLCTTGPIRPASRQSPRGQAIDVMKNFTTGCRIVNRPVFDAEPFRPKVCASRLGYTFSISQPTIYLIISLSVMRCLDASIEQRCCTITDEVTVLRCNDLFEAVRNHNDRNVLLFEFPLQRKQILTASSFKDEVGSSRIKQLGMF